MFVFILMVEQVVYGQYSLIKLNKWKDSIFFISFSGDTQGKYN